MRAASCEALVEALEAALPYMTDAGVTALDATQRAMLLAAMPGLKERAKTLVELWDGARFLFASRPAADRRQGGRHPGGAGSHPHRRAAAAAGSHAGMVRGRDRGSRRIYAEEAGAKLGRSRSRCAPR